MKTILGIGNPGPEYEGTRHNAGFEVADRLARLLKVRFREDAELRSLVARRPTYALLKPQTYVNLSGEAARRAVARFGLEPAELMVVSDEMALPAGTLRLRGSGSDGGHNGLRSVIAALGTDAFPRLRVGIGPPEAVGGAVDHVLGPWTAEERKLVEPALARAAEALSAWLRGEPLERLMARTNREPGEPPRGPGSKAARDRREGASE